MKRLFNVLIIAILSLLFFMAGLITQRLWGNTFSFAHLRYDIDAYLIKMRDSSTPKGQNCIEDFRDFSLLNIESAYLMPHKYGYEYNEERLSIVIAEIAYKMFREQLRNTTDLQELRMPLDIIASAIAPNSQQEDMAKMFKVTMLSVALGQLAPEDEMSYMKDLCKTPNGIGIIMLIDTIRSEQPHGLWKQTISLETLHEPGDLRDQMQ